MFMSNYWRRGSDPAVSITTFGCDEQLDATRLLINRPKELISYASVGSTPTKEKKFSFSLLHIKEKPP